MPAAVAVSVARFETEPSRPALYIAASWLVVNSNRLDVVAFVGDAYQATIFYVDTQGAVSADGDQGTS